MKKLLFFALLLVISAKTAFAQTSQKHIYIANDDHTDYMWTANEETYKSAFLEMLDYYLNQADSTALNTSDFQGRFNADGSLWMWTYEQNKSATDFQRLINRIKDGHITIPLNTLAIVFGGQPAEAVLRGMYYSGRIERRYNFRFPLALSMENQTLPFGVGSLWAGAGAKYSWKGICNCASQLSGAGNREKEIYWWQGLDNSKILLKWNSMMGGNGNMGMGGYAEARYPSSVVNYVDTDSSFKSIYPYNVIGAFGKGWDDLKTITDEFVTTAQNQSNANRRVIVSNEVDFFEDFENTYGASLATQSVSFGNEWDLFSASFQETSSRVKRAVEKLRSAEAMATLVSLNNPTFMNSYTTTRDQAFIDLSLFWEHSGGSGGAVGESTRMSWAKRMATSFESYVNTLYNNALTALSSQIQKSGTNTRFFVFNPLSWLRTDIADVLYTGSISIKVIDLTNNQEVPFQTITKSGTQYLRILASNIPSVGYKVYEIQSGTGQTFPQPVTVSAGNTVIENDYYKLTLAPRGAIISLIDKTRNNREFAKTISSKVINDLGSSTDGTLTVENIGPVSATILATSSTPASHTSRITLYNGINRIDIQNNITQNISNVLTWAYGFNLTNPEVNHEEVGAVIRARLSNDTTKPGQYSPRSNNTRYDYLTLNHFTDMTGTEGIGVTLSNWDVDFMKLGNSTVSSLDTATSQFSPVAGGNLGSGEDYSGGKDGGTTAFLQRFSLQTHDAYNQTSSMKFSLEHQNPLIAVTVTGGTVYPETSYSLFSISDPDVLLWALKPSEEGINQGIIARVWNQSDSQRNFTLAFTDRQATSAKQTTHIETNLADEVINNGSLTSSVTANQMKTYRLSTTASSHCQPLGNIDCLGTINVVDLSMLISKFGGSDIDSDLDDSGRVNVIDLSILLSNFGR